MLDSIRVLCYKNYSMDKKEIYEHLAKIYLDASSKTKRKKKAKVYPPFFKTIFFVSAAVVFLGLSTVLYSVFSKNKPFNAEVALVLLPGTAKINFNFDPAKKEAYSLDLKSLDISRFKALGFSAKTADYRDKVSLRVEFTSAFKEKSEIYFRAIPHKWQDYRVNLSEFKNISDWSDMLGISFTVEEWNVREKKGVVYLDNVRLLR